MLMLLLLLQFIFKILALHCGDKEIIKCKECDTDENLNICKICDDGYFPLLENSICISCNDPIYGQIGCKGNCNSSDYSNSIFNYCYECKEGYYNIGGICHLCDYKNKGCKKCKYDKDLFRCEECLVEDGYFLNSYNTCSRCSNYISNCDECHLNGTKYVCDKCLTGYFLSFFYGNGYCLSCYNKEIFGGYCYYCSDDRKPTYCQCYTNYTNYTLLNYFYCLKCPNNCDACEYSSEIHTAKCYKCAKGYYLDPTNQCLICNDNCEYCYYNNKNNSLVCLKYKELKCPDGCSSCEFDSEKNNIKCTDCYFGYIFDPKNSNCIKCNSIKELGEGCETCIYNHSREQYECQTCYTYAYFNSNYNNYSYVINKFQCLPNTDKSMTGLYNCLKSQYNFEFQKYECIECKNYTQTERDITLLINDKSCIDYSLTSIANCLELEIIGNSYSCVKCKPHNWK